MTLRWFISLLLSTSVISESSLTSPPPHAAATVDVVACIFNVLRRRAGLVELEIVESLQHSAQAQAEFMKKTNSVTVEGINGTKLWDRIGKSGYPWVFASSLAGMGHPTFSAFAYVLVEKFPHVINHTELAHVGVGEVDSYRTVDLASPRSILSSRPADCR